MKTMLKPLLFTGVALVLVVLIVFCGVHFWLGSSRGLDWVQARINAAIPGSVTIDSHQLSLLAPDLDLYGATLHGTGGTPLAGFDHLHVRLNWWALLKREIQLESFLLQAPWADLAVHETSGSNLVNALVQTSAGEAPADIPQSGEPQFIFNLIVNTAQLSDGRISYSAADDATRLDAEGITLAAGGNLTDRSGHLELDVARVRATTTGLVLNPARITLKAELANDRFSISPIIVALKESRIQFDGTAESIFDTPVMRGRLTANSQLTELAQILDLNARYAGQLSADLDVNGPLTNPDADVVIDFGGGHIAGQPLDHGRIALTINDRQIRLEPSKLRMADGSIIMDGSADLREALPGGLLSPPGDLDTITYALSLVQDTPYIGPWLERFIDIKGQMTSRLSLNGKGISPEIASARLNVAASGKNLIAPGMVRPIAADVDLSVQIDQGYFSMTHLEANADGAQILGSGKYQWEDRSMAGNFSLTAGDLSRFMPLMGGPSVEGTCNAELKVGGSLAQPQFSASLAANHLAVGAYTIGDLRVDADMAPDGRLKLAVLSLENQGSRILGNGQVRLLPNGDIDPGFINTLDLNIMQLSPADFTASSPILGVLNGKLTAGGPLQSLNADLVFNGRGLSVDTAAIGDLDARMRLEAGTLFLDRLNLKNGGSSLMARGSSQLLEPATRHLLHDPTIAITIASDHVDPNDFTDTASGDFKFTADLSGSVNNPSGRISLAGRQVSLAGQPVETIALDARIEERRLWLERLQATVVPGEQIEASGWIDWDKTIDLQMNTDGIAVGSIHRLKDFFPGAGRLGFDVAGKGSIDNPDIEGQLTVSDIVINDGPIKDVDLTFSLNDMLARASGYLNFEMDATCDLRKGDFDVSLIFDRTETAAYFKAAGQPDWHGTLTGQVQAAGNIHDAANASANIDLNALDLFFRQTPLIRSDRITARLVDRALSIPEFEIGLLSSGSLHLKGDARLDGSLGMEVNGRIPLSAAGVFSDELKDATGTLTLEGNLSGNADDPQINAQIELENIGLTIPGMVQRLHDLNGRIHLTPGHIRFDMLNGFLGTGSFRADGTMGLDKFTPKQVNLDIGLDSLPLEIPDTIAVLIDGDIHVSGNERSAEASGEIILVEGIYYKDVRISLLQLASSPRRQVAPAPRPVSIPYFETVNLDILIGHRQPFAVQNNLAQLEISPDLKIGGSLAQPVVSGRAQVREGTVTFQKKTFDVNKGVIDFINPYRTEAEIDIESQTQIRSWHIFLAVKGTPDNLDIGLTSQPAESEADILSLVLFGRTARELSAGEGGAELTTGQIMAEMLADSLGGDIKKSTGIDILQVETNGSSNEDDLESVKVTVGKHLSDRVTVKYAIETKDSEIIQRAITEYKLLEHILINGFQENTGVYGSELVFRIEFR